jgi:TfoX/Sxy family transcriptional regulator of competence genes
MAFAQDLAAGVRTALTGAGTIREVKMFGGIGFMLNGNLIAGASKRGLLLRVGRDRQSDALSQPGARPMVMRGRAMMDYIYVDPPALDDRAVRKWMKLAIGFVQTLPARPAAGTSNRVKNKVGRPPRGKSGRPVR